MAWTCLTPVPLICNELLNQVLVLYPGCSFKFDPTLTYEESIRGVRAMRSAFDVTQQQTFPLFTYSMEHLAPYTEMRKQFPIRKDLTNPALPIATQYKSRFCAFEMNWRWYTTDIIAMKTFEVMFATETSINLVKDVTLSFTDVGDFQYQVVWPWEGLTGVTYNKQDNLYMSCDGKVQVFGEFIMASDLPAKLIAQINLKIYDYLKQSKIIDEATITATGTTWLPQT